MQLKCLANKLGDCKGDRGCENKIKAEMIGVGTKMCDLGCFQGGVKQGEMPDDVFEVIQDACKGKTR